MSPVLAFSPNGMGMDLLRSCSTQRARYDPNDAMKTAVLRWYFCAPSAEVFPEENAFGSPVWDQAPGIQTSLGFDATASRSYYRGTRQNTSDGRTFAGPAEFFRSGQSTDSTPLALGVNLTPVDCLRAPFGVAIGGGITPLSPTVKVGCYPYQIPRYVTMRVSNVPVIGPSCSGVTFDVIGTFDPNWRGWPAAMYYPNGGWTAAINHGGHVQNIGFGCSVGSPPGLQANWYCPSVFPSAFLLTLFPTPPPVPRVLHWEGFAFVGDLCSLPSQVLALDVSF